MKVIEKYNNNNNNYNTQTLNVVSNKTPDITCKSRSSDESVPPLKGNKVFLHSGCGDFDKRPEGKLFLLQSFSRECEYLCKILDYQLRAFSNYSLYHCKGFI